MFIGHFGVGFGAKSIVPKVSLGTLFLAAQFLDLLWPTLLLLNLEQVRIVPGATVVTPLLFVHYPISHSLLAVLGWAILVGGLYFGLKRDKKSALILGILVISHWLLDVIVHQPDLPLYPGSVVKLGLDAWASLPLTLLVEGSLFAAGVWLYARCTTPANATGRWGFYGLVSFLVLIYIGNLFGAPPPSAQAIAWAGQAQWLLVLWGYWIDGHRHAAAR
jgi:LexA-binding, inner membrane-associated putative hydrolase